MVGLGRPGPYLAGFRGGKRGCTHPRYFFWPQSGGNRASSALALTPTTSGTHDLCIPRGLGAAWHRPDPFRSAQHRRVVRVLRGDDLARRRMGPLPQSCEGSPGYRQLSVADEPTVRAAQVLFGLTCVFYGWSHFAYADYTASMVPSWLPERLGIAYFTGLCHIAAGVGVIFGIFPRLAAILEAIMMSLFGLLVWMPSFWAQPRPKWATPPQNQWSEVVVNLVLAASAYVVATSLGNRAWGFRKRSRA